MELGSADERSKQGIKRETRGVERLFDGSDFIV
jgi:hypothetical protein